MANRWSTTRYGISRVRSFRDKPRRVVCARLVMKGTVVSSSQGRDLALSPAASRPARPASPSRPAARALSRNAGGLFVFWKRQVIIKLTLYFGNGHGNCFGCWKLRDEKNSNEFEKGFQNCLLLNLSYSHTSRG